MTAFAARILAILACGPSYIEKFLGNNIAISGRDILVTSYVIGSLFWMRKLTQELSAYKICKNNIIARIDTAERSILDCQSNISLLNRFTVRLDQEALRIDKALGELVGLANALRLQNDSFEKQFKNYSQGLKHCLTQLEESKASSAIKKQNTPAPIPAPTPTKSPAPSDPLATPRVGFQETIWKIKQQNTSTLYFGQSFPFKSPFN